MDEVEKTRTGLPWGITIYLYGLASPPLAKDCNFIDFSETYLTESLFELRLYS